MEKKKGNTTKEFSVLREQLNDDFKHHTGILYEKFRENVKQVADLSLMANEKADRIEGSLFATNKKVDRIEGKLEATFEMVGKLTLDMEIIKQDVVFIKNGLKKKADLEEFEALERRVAIIEARFFPKQTT